MVVSALYIALLCVWFEGRIDKRTMWSNSETYAFQVQTRETKLLDCVEEVLINMYKPSTNSKQVFIDLPVSCSSRSDTQRRLEQIMRRSNLRPSIKIQPLFWQDVPFVWRILQLEIKIAIRISTQPITFVVWKVKWLLISVPNPNSFVQVAKAPTIW